MNKFEKWLDEEIEYPDNRISVGLSPLETLKLVRRKYLALAPTTESKGGDNTTMMGVSGARPYRPASPTKADKVEPLAVLADRDEIEIEIKGPSVGWSGDTKWVIYFHCNEDTEFFTGETYQEAENLARAFLTGLDDVTGKGGRV